jgi:hypothetical protein
MINEIGYAVLILIIIMLVAYIVKFRLSYQTIPNHTFMDSNPIEVLNAGNEMEAKLLCNHRPGCQGILTDGAQWKLMDASHKLTPDAQYTAIRRRHLLGSTERFSHPGSGPLDELDAAATPQPKIIRHVRGPNKGDRDPMFAETFIPNVMDTGSQLYRYANQGGSVGGLNEPFSTTLGTEESTTMGA